MYKIHAKKSTYVVWTNFFLQPCILSHFVFSLENCNYRHCWLDNGKYLVKHKFKLQAVELLGKTSQFHQCFMIVIITLSTLYFAFLIHAIFSLEMMMMMMMKMIMMIMIKMMMITMMMMMKARKQWNKWNKFLLSEHAYPTRVKVFSCINSLEQGLPNGKCRNN